MQVSDGSNRSYQRAHRPITTVKGRVVYDRKKHPFSWKDALRVMRAASPWLSLWADIVEYFDRLWDEYMKVLDEWIWSARIYLEYWQIIDAFRKRIRALVLKISTAVYLEATQQEAINDILDALWRL